MIVDGPALPWLLRALFAASQPPGVHLRPCTATCAGGKRRRPVWTDPADASLSVDVASVPRLRKLRASKGQTAMSGAEYEAALRRQHAALHPRTSWAAHKVAAAGRGRGGGGGGGGDAEPDDADEPDEDAAAALLRSAGGLLAGGGTRGLLAPQVLELSRLRDANGSSPSDAVVQSLQFHPNGQLLLTAGFDKRLKLFQVRRGEVARACVPRHVLASLHGRRPQ